VLIIASLLKVDVNEIDSGSETMILWEEGIIFTVSSVLFACVFTTSFTIEGLLLLTLIMGCSNLNIK
jgi:hypothetical protein